MKTKKNLFNVVYNPIKKEHFVNILIALIIFTPQGIGHHILNIRLPDTDGQLDLLRDGMQGCQDTKGSGHAKLLLDTPLAEKLWCNARDTLQNREIPTTVHPSPLGP